MVIKFGLKLRVHIRDGWRCVYCGLKMTPDDRRLHTDHADPVGGDTLENLVTCCASCNGNKRSRTKGQFLAGEKVEAPLPQYFSELLARICAEHKTTAALLTGTCRRADLVAARRAFSFEARRRGASLPEIGRALRKHHTSIMHLLKSAT